MLLTAYIQVWRWAEVPDHLTVAIFISDLEGEIHVAFFHVQEQDLPMAIQLALRGLHCGG